MKWIPWIGLVMLGCGPGGPSYLPLQVGKEWTYTVKSAFREPIVTLKVVGRTPVGVKDGFLLRSSASDVKLAWDGPRLIASQLGNTKFNPPITLFREDKIPELKKPREFEFVSVGEWAGKLESFDTPRNASAKLELRRAQIEVKGQKVKIVQSKLTIDVGKGTMEILTDFERGRGIINQTQRTNRKLLVSLEMVQEK